MSLLTLNLPSAEVIKSHTPCVNADDRSIGGEVLPPKLGVRALEGPLRLAIEP